MQEKKNMNNRFELFKPLNESLLFLTESTVEQNVSVILNGVESELKFVIGQKGTKVKYLVAIIQKKKKNAMWFK